MERVVVERLLSRPDPRGYVATNLGKHSLFYVLAGEERYYGADYDTSIVNSHHHGETQEYMLVGTPMACDLFVNLPKMKTHKKTGIMCCLKNLVGVNGDKNCLLHHTEGGPNRGGDEFPDRAPASVLEARFKKIGMKMALDIPELGTFIYRKMRKSGIALLRSSDSRIRNGNWSGNDTCWRMVLDLNRCLLYGNIDGSGRRKRNWLGMDRGYQGEFDVFVSAIRTGSGLPVGFEEDVSTTLATFAIEASLKKAEPVAVRMPRENS